MVYEKVKEIMLANLSVDENKLKMDAKLTSDLGLDSLDAVELNMALEEEFKIEISDEAMADLTTIKDIVEYIEKQLEV